MKTRRVGGGRGGWTARHKGGEGEKKRKEGRREGEGGHKEELEWMEVVLHILREARRRDRRKGRREGRERKVRRREETGGRRNAEMG